MSQSKIDTKYFDMLESERVVERVALASMEHCPPSVLEPLAVDEELEVRCTLARNQAAGDRIWSKLAADKIERVRICLASNASLPEFIYLKLAEDASLRVRVELVNNAKLPVAAVRFLVLHDEDPWVRSNVLNHPNISDKALESVSIDQNPRVRMAVASHPKAAKSILSHLSVDVNESVRVAVAMNGAISGGIARRLAYDPSPVVRRTVAEYGLLDSESIAVLCADEDERVRDTVMKNPSIGEEQLLKVVSSGIIRNVNAKAVLYQRLYSCRQFDVKGYIASEFGVATKAIMRVVAQAVASGKGYTEIQKIFNALTLFRVIYDEDVAQVPVNEILETIESTSLGILQVRTETMTAARQLFSPALVSSLFNIFGKKKAMAMLLRNDAAGGIIMDMFDMFARSVPHLTEVATNHRRDLRSFGDVHDIFAREVKKIGQANFSLYRDGRDDALIALNKVQVDKEHVIRIPETSHELIDYGEILDICIGGGGYAKRAMSGECLLFALVGIEDERLRYCVEISNGEIIQAKGRRNSEMPSQVRSAMIRVLAQAGLVS